MQSRFLSALSVLALLGAVGSSLALGQQPEQIAPVPARIVQSIDNTSMVALTGNVRKDLTPDRDLGEVEPAKALRLVLLLKPSTEQQAALDNLIARQQQPGAAEYHKWLTPKEYGARFGVGQGDIATIKSWLESQGFEVKSVLNNGTMIDFAATAGGVKNTFKTPLHYWNIADGKYMANTQNPQIPAALADVVAGIKGLAPVPARPAHTPIRPIQYNKQTHQWDNVAGPSEDGIQPAYLNANGQYVETPQDLYTIYNVNPIFATGNLGKGSTVSIPEVSDMDYGTLSNGTTGQASGGVINNFRSNFGVASTLNMVVMHGAGSVSCGDPGSNGAESEASLDADWANALAPAAQLLFMSCDNSGSTGDGLTTAELALVDNNLSDVISVSYDGPETTDSDYTFDDQLYTQAASQGQTFIIAGGDSGSDTADQNTGKPAVSGYNVSRLASSPLVTAAGGTDFADLYDQIEGGPKQSTYWSSTNSQFYGDALGYIPETVWNSSCASSLIAKVAGNTTPAAYCATEPSRLNSPVGGGGGVSIHYAQPAYQTGVTGLSSSIKMRAYPDISLFAANGSFGHLLVTCDSEDPCTSPSTFGGAGGTSFVTPQLAGVTALLINATGSRQGTLNPTLYALAKAQFTNAATATACYSNGQTNNTGVTTGLPAAACIFHDVTTSNNDVGCLAGSLDCYVNSGAPAGVLSLGGASALTIAYSAGAGYDEATGLGTLNVANLINNWNTAFTSSTSLKANPTSIASTASTTLTATVTGGTPPNYNSGGTPPNYNSGVTPPVTGSVNFNDGTTAIGSCTLSGGTCSTSVAGTALQTGSNSITATFVGSKSYPASTSSIVIVTVTGSPKDTTAPTVSLTGIVTGPPKQETFSSKDNTGGSGLASVVVTNCSNCTSSTQAFTKGTSSAVTTTATKTNQSQSSSITIVATDVAGNSTTYDPVDLQVESTNGPTEHLVTINSLESKVLISNGTPGISWMVLMVNGRFLPLLKLSDGESTTLDISKYLHPGNSNQVLIIADGKKDATSWIIFTQP